jgi:hypothetical protein
MSLFTRQLRSQKIKWFDLVCFQASGAPRPENWDSDEIPNPYWIYYAKFALCWFPASHYFKNYVHSQKIKLFDSEIPDPSWIYFIRILEFTLIRILNSHLFKYSNNSNTIPKTHHVIHALSKFNYIFSSCMHSKRYSQEEVRFRSQMLYTVFSLSRHSSQADPSFKRTIFLRPVIPYAIIN